MNKFCVLIGIFLFVYLNFSSGICDNGSNESYSDSSRQKGTQSNYMIIRYVIGSGGVLGSTNASKIHSATAGETVVGFMQGENSLLLSGFWQPGYIFDDVNENTKVHPPNAFVLHQNYPNPFNPQTALQYELPAECRIRIEIFNVAGQCVRLLIDNEIQGPGAMDIVWNGLNDNGEMLSSGVYLCRIHGRSTESEKSNSREGFQDTIKMLLVR
jgi:hypothetical protein